MDVDKLRVLAISSFASLLGCHHEDGSSGDEASADQPPALSQDPELIFHPEQPMVVDVILDVDRSALVELAHDDDPGVRVGVLATSEDGLHHELRVRGLAPEKAHALTLTLTDSDDPARSANEPLEFVTNPPRSGFRPSFAVEVADSSVVDPAYRMFDFAYTPLWEPAGIFVIDSEGITRWYYDNGPPELDGATAIWAGVELLADGSVLAVRDAAITLIDELGVQQLRISADELGVPAFHHDVRMLANGNILTLTNSFEVVDYSSLGLDAETVVAGDLLVEVSPEAELVWTWDAFDHLDPLRLRSTPNEALPYLDPDSGELGYDWTHGNGMIELVDQDLIVLSMRHQDWLVGIDHATGEVAWRLGPEGDFDLLAGTWFYHQHSPQWQADGSLLVYDNGLGNPMVPIAEVESRAVRYAIDFDAMTATQIWDSSTGEAMLSPVAGDADLLGNGNVLVLHSTLQPDPSVFDIGKNHARVIEVRGDGDPSPVWSLTTQSGSFVYRATPIERLPGEL